MPSPIRPLGINLGNCTCRIIEGTSIKGQYYLRQPTEGMFEDGKLYNFRIFHGLNRASQIMRLLGRKFSDPELQSELGFVPFGVIEGPDGYPLIHAMVENRAFTPTEILAMLISHLDFCDSKNCLNPDPLYSKYKPRIFPTVLCIAIPSYFTNRQINGVLEAFHHVVRSTATIELLDETTAMAMAYLKSWSFHSLREDHNVVFVDIGHASMQVCFAKVEAKIDIFYKAYLKSVGGRNFDRVLFNHFVDKIREDYDINVYESARDCVLLLDACEGLKKDLSKYNEASFSIKFSNEKDVKGSINREVFEKLSIPILKKIKAALKKAMRDSKLNTRTHLFVEAVGNGCSVPAIIGILREVFGTEPRKMACCDEYVVRGCAVKLTKDYIYTMDRQVDVTKHVTNLVSFELPLKGINEEDQQKRQHWINAMIKEGHSLICFKHELNVVGQNIAIMDKRKNANSFWKPWLWRAQSGQNTDDTTSVHIAEDKEEQNESTNQKEDKPTLRSTFSESIKRSSKQVKSERDNAQKEDELRELKEDTPSSSNSVGYFSEFSYLELQDATNNFDQSYMLGQGGFGTVYKGTLHKTTVAIKMLKEGSSQGTKEFNMEVEILSKVRHPNLVTLIGACSESRALIYEYLPNGSLEDHLKCKSNTPPLSWQTRVRIAFEICSALNFLHCSKPHGIAHGDLKPDNILLDSNYVSKISDFGLCRELNWTDSASVPFHETDCPKGTLAYMDPEYLSTGKMTPQYDIYSFGIILLRLVTGKHPRGLSYLVEEAQENGKVKTLIDSSAGAWPFKEAMKMISLGLRCSHPIRRNRPNLSTEVWSEMESIVAAASESGPSLLSRLVRRH